MQSHSLSHAYTFGCIHSYERFLVELLTVVTVGQNRCRLPLVASRTSGWYASLKQPWIACLTQGLCDSLLVISGLMAASSQVLNEHGAYRRPHYYIKARPSPIFNMQATAHSVQDASFLAPCCETSACEGRNPCLNFLVRCQVRAPSGVASDQPDCQYVT